MVNRLQYYQPDDWVYCKGRRKKLSISIDKEIALKIAERSRGTPRIAIKLLKRVRDVAQLDNCENISLAHVDQALLLQQVDAEGLDEHYRRFLTALRQQFKGGPVGLNTLAAALSETPHH